MSILRIKNSKLKGEVFVNHSKSYLHRYIFASSFAAENTIIKGFDLSEDIKDTMLSLISFADFDLLDSGDVLVKPRENKKSLDRVRIEASGTTLRFMLFNILDGNLHEIYMGDKLFERPNEPAFKIFDANGIKYRINDKNKSISIKGDLVKDEYIISEDISSQFVSSLLFKLARMDFDSRIVLDCDLSSRSYIDMTIKCLKDFGVEIDASENEFKIKGGQEFKSAGEYIIERDYSNAANYYAANYLGSDIDIMDMAETSIQADKMVKDTLLRYNQTQNLTIDMKNSPDAVPILAMAALFRKHKTTFTSVKRLMYKESNRVQAIINELKKIGAKITFTDDSLIVNPLEDIIMYTNKFDAYNDHRIAMMIAILATRLDQDIFLSGYECVNKSYPKFFEDYISLGGEVNVIDNWK